ncbi:DUF2306 domain-containing protein [Gemmobacter lutimaris]|uniref:DUF2306 domain-containing protein n=1 Tax=Gemmobacter lutimaris TaxID=2306023 RepID=A0A398C0B5_9RHOB|nr:DUF2306 domain-containing protein [Gemmobacter lutimaris]RID92906.1 DUF2306 domain-containing protein [Gemmobacter lutimaris]
MSLTPLLNAAPAIQLHTVAAMTAIGLGGVQFAGRKGGARHRLLGWIWVLLMTGVAASSFFIGTICTWRGFSLIHLLSALTLVALPIAIAHARAHRVVRHARTMRILFFGALILAGVFTLMPGRIMHDVLFGTLSAHGDCTAP